MKNPLVSIIIPVYNAANYLQNIISCLQKQTYSNIEFIFINDGSKDNSLGILNTSTKVLRNCHVHSYENAGAATARNRGLDVCHGDIICFLDCDDEITQNYVEELIKPFERDDKIDVSICGYQKEFLTGETKSYQVSNVKKVINKRKAITYIFNNHHTNMIVPWAKAVRKELFAIRFPITRCEDEAISYQLFLKCRKISLIPLTLYKYVERNDSDSKNDNFGKIIDICNIYYDRFLTLKNANICKHKSFYVFAFTYFGFFHKIDKDKKEKLYTINGKRLKGVFSCFFSFRIIKFLLLYLRYKLDLKGLK